MRDNLVVLGRGFYLVRTQAGFRKAIKHRFANSPDIAEERPSNYPRSYPAIVSISTEYRGYWYPSVNWIPLNDLLGQIKESE